MTTYSIIKKSELESSNRIDAEYYQPKYLYVKNKLFSSPILGDISKKITDFGAYSQMNFVEYTKSGIRFLRNQDVGESFIEDIEPIYISHETYKRLSLKLEEYDILTPRVGTIGTAAVIFKDYLPASANQNLAQIKPDLTKIDPIYLSVFLNSRFGHLQFDQFATGNVQPWLNLSQIQSIKIFIPTKNVQDSVKNLALKALEERNNSKSLYSQAENLLLDELKLRDIEKKVELWNVVNLSETKEAGRIDSEYFQPLYEKLISKIKSKEFQTLENFVKTYSTGFPFKSDNYQEDGIPLIRINNIQKGYLDLNNSTYLTEKDYLLSPKDIAKPGDIVLSMSGTIGMTALVPDDIPKSIINQRILRITSQNIEKDYLVLLLNSIVGLYQLERIGTGGVQTNISYKDIKNIFIPTLQKITQQEISELVKKSHEAHKKAKELLEEAKHKVEELIENNPK